MIHAIIFAKITSENNSFNEPVLVISTSFEYAVISYFLFMSNEKENVNYITSSGCDLLHVSYCKNMVDSSAMYPS